MSLAHCLWSREQEKFLGPSQNWNHPEAAMAGLTVLGAQEALGVHRLFSTSLFLPNVQAPAQPPSLLRLPQLSSQPHPPNWEGAWLWGRLSGPDKGLLSGRQVGRESAAIALFGELRLLYRTLQGPSVHPKIM